MGPLGQRARVVNDLIIVEHEAQWYVPSPLVPVLVLAFDVMLEQETLIPVMRILDEPLAVDVAEEIFEGGPL
jgi:hypothetical protein